MREELAVGLIETRGLVAAIEACDAALKSADVKLISIDRVDAGLMTVKLVGEVAAVQSAVDAGRLAAARVGTLVAAHVIPRPDVGLHDELIYTEVRPRKKKQNESPLPTSSTSTTAVTPAPPTSSHSTTATPAAPTPTSEASEAKPSLEHLDRMTVHELRRYARTLPNFPIQGREISRAGKETLLKLLRQLNG
ncbi:MAG: BMC domain-containing protein [Chloroherpetonaceae bacterium]